MYVQCTRRRLKKSKNDTDTVDCTTDGDAIEFYG